MKAKSAAPQHRTAFDKISSLNRPSHYERYGTIELLLSIKEDDSGLLQLLMAEGYDCQVLGAEDPTEDLMGAFNSKDVSFEKCHTTESKSYTLHLAPSPGLPRCCPHGL